MDRAVLILVLLGNIDFAFCNHNPCLEKTLEKAEEEANVIFTGTVRDLYNDFEHPDMMKANVEVKRIMKGDNVISRMPGKELFWPFKSKIVTVEGLGDPHICHSAARKHDTRIFMLNPGHNGDLKLNSSLIRLTMNNVIRADAAVHHKPFTTKPPVTMAPCDVMFCAYGARCILDSSNTGSCQCIEQCDGVVSPVCGSDGETYDSECILMKTSCSEQRLLMVASRGKCGVQDPCLSMNCQFGANCEVSVDGLKARCQCPDRCYNFGDSVGSKPVCGSDFKDYPNVCEMKRTACEHMLNITVLHEGSCDPCRGYSCENMMVCQLDDKRQPTCRCNPECPLDFAPVCATDGQTYSNECIMKVEACKWKKNNLRVHQAGQCPSGLCDTAKCSYGEECQIDRSGRATCVCPSVCELVVRPVCASDGRTYENECEMKISACRERRMINVLYQGKCSDDGPCSNYQCDFWGMCVVSNGAAICKCPMCTEHFEPVCGTDNVSYTNECKMRLESCEKKETVAVKYQGLCTNKCHEVRCANYAVCEEGQCVCPTKCPHVKEPVCGTDGVTYDNECQMKIAACKQQLYIVVASHGACDKCADVHCKFGAICQHGRCVCPTDCPMIREPICASDGRTYNSPCEMKDHACKMSTDLEIIMEGPCEDDETSGSGMESCDKENCRFGGICEWDAEGPVRCLCNFKCDAVRDSVCGSDGVTYGNECQMREESCRKQKLITQQNMDNCEGLEDDLCDGQPPLMNSKTGEEFDCGAGQDTCPPYSYCHKVGSLSRCCREEGAELIGCAGSKYGCCPDRKTAAPGPNSAGCPSICQCNTLGSYTTTCNPDSSQCSCKPGVGGLRCDRCEPGYWGLQLVTDGREGCSPCGCNIYGSVREDCEQMSGMCSCKPGFIGDKCNKCPDGSEIGPNGCRSNAAAPPSCDDLNCKEFGGSCEIVKGVPTCQCPSKCPDTEKNLVVCGSDGVTYTNPCLLKLYSCKIQKPINVLHVGPCQAVDSFYLNDFGDATSYHVPSFTGESYLELKPLRHIKRDITIEMDFSSINSDAILFYSGQNKDGSGDFVAIVVRDGLVEFRYDLGGGMATITNPTPLQPGVTHRVIARRFKKEGKLKVDSDSWVEGVSPGSLDSLNLDGQSVFLGYIPELTPRVYKNVQVKKGLVGCIHSLRVDGTNHTHEYSLVYPSSEDILNGIGISECGSNPCQSMPCLNGATCEVLESPTYKCQCAAGFTGLVCDERLSGTPCFPNPCENGGHCNLLSNDEFTCVCPAKIEGELCEIAVSDTEEITVPNLQGNNYLEFPITTEIGKTFRFEVWFLSRSTNGLILYSEQGVPGGDYLSLSVEKAQLHFRFNLGSKPADIIYPEPLKLNNWTKVLITRNLTTGYLTVNDGKPVQGEAEGRLTDLNVKDRVYLGGMPYDKKIPGLDGAIQKFVENGRVYQDLWMSASLSQEGRITQYHGKPCDPDPCADNAMCVPVLNNYQCLCSVGYEGVHCDQESAIIVDESLPLHFDGKSHQRYGSQGDTKRGQVNNSIEIRFKTDAENGLLLLQHKSHTTEGDFVAIAIVKGYVQTAFNLGKQSPKQLLTITSQTPVKDGGWHTAKFERVGRKATLQVDSEDPQMAMAETGANQLDTDGNLWVGGSPNMPSGLPPVYYTQFTGCVQAVHVEGRALNLVSDRLSKRDIQFCTKS